MAQHDVELILMKQVASYLATPIFLVNPKGDLLYYNEPAEAILGQRYDETGELELDAWGTMFTPRGPDGDILSPEELPLVRALRTLRPAHGRFSILGLDGVTRDLSVTAFPLIGPHEGCIGAVAIFWENAA
jgi:hypothetical protein